MEIGRRVNEIVDRYRAGENPEDLIVLLDSADPRLVSFGAYVLGEIATEYYNFPMFTTRLRQLLHHEDSAVRLHAFGALYSTLDWSAASTRALVSELLAHSDENMRDMAKRAAARLPSH